MSGEARSNPDLAKIGSLMSGVAASLAARDKTCSPGLPPAVAFWVRTIRAIETDLTAGLPRLVRRQLPQRAVELMAAQIVAGIEVVVDDVRRRNEEGAAS